jgi:KUP system potassium uptake protein
LPLFVGLAFVVVMVTWARGRGLLGAYFRDHSEPTAKFFESLAVRAPARVPGVGVVMTASAESIPPVLLRMVSRFRTLHEKILLTTVVTEEIPFVEGERVTIDELAPSFYRVLVRFGFLETPAVHEALSLALARVDPAAKADDLTYVLGHERFLGGRGGRMGPWAERLFGVLTRNANNPTDFYAIPPSQVVEIGARIDL